MNAQKLQSSVECAGQPELLVKDGDYQIGSYSNPYLRLHGVGACPIVMLDSQVSLDPTEEQFDAPSHLVKHSHCQSGDLQVVGQEDEFLCGFRIEEFHSPEENGKDLPGLRESWFANMIALQAGEPIYRLGVMPSELKVALCSRHKKGSSVGNQNESCEVHVASIHQIERTGLEQEAVEPSHVVLPRSRDIDAGRNRSSQIDLCVNLDPSLGLTEIGPRKESQGKIDSCRIQRIDRVVQIQTKILARIERPGLPHQTLGEVFPDTPVSLIVGIGKSRFGNRLGEAKMIECLGSGVETRRDVAETLPRSHLSKHHADKLLTAFEMADAFFRAISSGKSGKRCAFDQFYNLGKDVATGVHRLKIRKIPRKSSNA